MNEELKSTHVCYGENVLMMRIDDCIVFGNKSALQNYVQNRIEKTDEWILVSERVPEYGDIVIVTVKDESGDTPYSYTQTGLCVYKDCWIVDNDIRRDVIAWMRIPPTKGGAK